MEPPFRIFCHNFTVLFWTIVSIKLIMIMCSTFQAQTPDVNHPNAAIDKWSTRYVVRAKLDVGPQIVSASAIIPENAGNNVSLFDISQHLPGSRILAITGNSAGVDNMFVISEHTKIFFNSTLLPSDRKKFDFETYSLFEIYINALQNSSSEVTCVYLSPSGVAMLTIQLQLSDVNDEPPYFTMQPQPYMANVPVIAEPGELVYLVEARDTDQDPRLDLRILSVEPQKYFSRFSLLHVSHSTPQEVVGRLVTVGDGAFNSSQSIRITISVQDKGGVDQLAVATLHIVAGIRPPEFYSSTYTCYIDESVQPSDRNIATLQSGTPLVIEVKNFESSPLTFSLLESNGEVSKRFYIDDKYQVINKKLIDFETTKSVSLTVRATQTSRNLSSTARLEIFVRDKNDNAPQFTRPQFRVMVPEDAQNDSTILTVNATDLDSGVNRELVYFLMDNDYFYIDTANETTQGQSKSVGHLKVKSPLDYEKKDKRLMAFEAFVKDKGIPSKTATTQILISITNVNDNPPTVQNNTIKMIKTVHQGFVLTVVQASDIDGDNIHFAFPEMKQSNYIFSINRDTGMIKTTQRVPDDSNKFELTILAVDDGSCCNDLGKKLTSTATLVVNIEVINSNKPNFTQCVDYDMNVSVKELSPNGTHVYQVVAVDQDEGESGQIIYSLHQGGNFFDIDQDSGNITVIRDIARKHGDDGHPYITVTVNGKNPGNVPLMQGWCAFRIKIEDINDHTPMFAQQQYTEKISISSQPGKVVRQMKATDDDFGVNADIKYQMSGPGADTFHMNETTGIITLRWQLDQTITSYELSITASDQGVPKPLSNHATLEIKIDSGNVSSPRWIIDNDTKVNLFVPETLASHSKISNFTCLPNAENPKLEFIVYDAAASIRESSREFFSQKVDNTTMHLVTSQTFDYNKKNKFDIVIVCKDFNEGSLPDKLYVTINIKDENNERPIFFGLADDGRYKGSVIESSTSRQSVALVQVIDEDQTPEFKNIKFVLRTKDLQSFSVSAIDSNHAQIVTNATFDREAKDVFHLEVTASDDENQVIRYIDVSVLDVNDNPPSFDHSHYNHSVPESASVDDLLFSVTARDDDSIDQELGLNYFFEDETTFSISSSGDIRVRRRLDYENLSKFYSLTLIATDQGAKHNATTTVNIKVLDENDNPPVFSKSIYDVKGVVSEGNSSVSPQNPLFLIQINATDADEGRPETAIRFFLLNGMTTAQTLFSVNSTSGEIFLNGILDRDRIQPFYIFTVKAEDEHIKPLISYVDVRVFPMDVNDNKPVFEDASMTGYVEENSENNTQVTNVIAHDIDQDKNGLVQYKLSPEQPDPQKFNYFRINSDGKIYTNTDPKNLDHERITEIHVSIIAYDLGKPSLETTGTVTLSIQDINDQSPYFPNEEYNITISEEHTGMVVDQPIMAVDKDSNPANRNLSYSLETSPPYSSTFTVTTIDNEIAFITVKPNNPLDYELDPHELSFHLKVSDGVHDNDTWIRVFITDFNDNAPVFEESLKEIKMSDGAQAGSYVTTFTATDQDEGINAEIVYSILRKTDPRYEFYINPKTGKITTRKTLDRELESQIDLVVMAQDRGKIPLNSTAQLKILLIDVNDYAPEFKESYLPKVEENIQYEDTQVIEIFALDRDSLPYGPPFGFKLPDACLSAACKHFQLEMNEVGDNGNGTAIIKTSSKFDREVQKEYHLPIIMWDMRGKMDERSKTATNTLTVIVGDKNDNRHGPGHQDIHVYTYHGIKGSIQIGRVYAADLDDWDLPDKTFTFLSPDVMKSFFNVSEASGMITMLKDTPPSGSQPFSTYDFKVKVHDKKFGNTETCSVSVTVETLNDQALYQSGSMRLSGISSEDFIIKQATETSLSDRFRQKFASILGYGSKSNVEIVSLRDGKDGLEVRFSAHGSPYLNPAQVESAVMLHQSQIESSLGITIKMLPVNLCMEEVYDTGCSMVLNVTNTPNLVNTNGTSYVSVTAFTAPVSDCLDCKFPTPEKCSGNYCYNGGTCIQDDWGKIICQCLPGFDGSRCQQRHHHYDGSSIAFYQSFSVCSVGRTEFDFITLEENGVILYNGPSQTIDPKDFFIFGLQSGYPQLGISFGVGELVLKLDGKDKAGIPRMPKLNDGKWHHIDIDKNYQNIQLTVDKCRSAVVSPGGHIHDWSPCQVIGEVPGPDILLNVPGFLQIGGSYQNSFKTFDSNITLSAKGFSGCLKDLVHNTKLYDLSYKNIPYWNSGEANCPREKDICDRKDDCGIHADCKTEWTPKEQVVECTCHPGWKGHRCEKETPIKDFDTQSFFKWKLSPQAISNARRELSVLLMFRTRQERGTLFYMANAQLNSIAIELREGKLVLTYKMENEINTLNLGDANIASGQWHTLRFERFGSEFVIAVDNGEGRNYNYQISQNEMTVIFESLSVVSSGAVVDLVTHQSNFLSEDIANTCISDLRFNEEWLPMDMKDNPNEPSSSKLLEIKKVKDGCHRQDCVNDTCGLDKICFPLWEREECRCPVGSSSIYGSRCETWCDVQVCYHGGTCKTDGNVSTCHCIGPWIGHLCNIVALKESKDDSFSAGIIAGIIIAIIILLVFLLVIIFFIARGKKETEKEEMDDEDDFIRENIMYYDEEGAGECDNHSFYMYQNPSLLPENNFYPGENTPKEISVKTTAATPGRNPKFRNIIDSKLNDSGNHIPDNDSLREFAEEGAGSLVGSLSSLSTQSDDESQDYDYLGDLGPKFSLLANMYGADDEPSVQQV